MRNEWKKIDGKVVYENPWITVHHEDVLAPTGTKTIYGRVHFKNYAIGIIPIDESHNTWLIGQQRYPTDHYSWEIPEGGGIVGQDALTAAKRELKEEAGLNAGNWKEIQRIHLSNSVSDEIGIIYLATGLTFTDVMPDATEELTIRKLHFDEAFAMMESGEIVDTMTVIALLKVKRMFDSNLL